MGSKRRRAEAGLIDRASYSRKDPESRVRVRRRHVEFSEEPGEPEAAAVRDELIRLAGPDVESFGNVLARADGATRARAVSCLQEEQGNRQVQRLVNRLVIARSGSSDASAKGKVQRLVGEQGVASRITKGPGGVPAVVLGRRFTRTYHPGLWIGTNVILDVFEKEGKVNIAWYDLSRSRHEIRPLDLFEKWLEVGPAGDIKPSDQQAYLWLRKELTPADWYRKAREDPVKFFMGKLEELRPRGATEQHYVERTLAPAAYRAAIKQMAMNNLAESEKMTNRLLSKGAQFFAVVADPWVRKAALEAERVRIHSAMPMPAAGASEPELLSSSGPDLRRVEKDLNLVELQAEAKAKEVPLLRFMQKKNIPITPKGVEETLKEILANIDKTREAIWTNRLDPMQLKELRQGAPEQFAQFKTTLRGEQPAAEAFAGAKWEKTVGTLFFEIMLLFVTGGVGTFFSMLLGAAETAVAAEKRMQIGEAAETSPGEHGAVGIGEEEINEADAEIALSAVATFLSALSLLSELKGARLARHPPKLPREKAQLAREVAVVQLGKETKGTLEQIETIKKRLSAIRRAASKAGKIAPGERAGAEAVLRSTKKTIRQLTKELQSDLSAMQGHASKLKEAAKKARQVAEAGRASELLHQAHQIETLIEEWERLAFNLELMAKGPKLVEERKARKEVSEARHAGTED